MPKDFVVMVEKNGQSKKLQVNSTNEESVRKHIPWSHPDWAIKSIRLFDPKIDGIAKKLQGDGAGEIPAPAANEAAHVATPAIEAAPTTEAAPKV